MEPGVRILALRRSATTAYESIGALLSKSAAEPDRMGAGVTVLAPRRSATTAYEI